MLQAWMPRRWALLGGLLTAFHPLIIKWSQGFWGGSVQLTGALIVCGAARRLTDTCRRPADAVWLAVGLSILANSRPYEGGIFGAIVAIGLWWVLRPGSPRLIGPSARGRLAAARAASIPRDSKSASFARLAIPFAVVIGLVIAWMAYFNWRVTGSPIRLPYAVHAGEYGVAPPVLFLPLRPFVPPMTRYDSMREVDVIWAIPNYLDPLSSWTRFVWSADNSAYHKAAIALRSAVLVWEVFAYGTEGPPFWQLNPSVLLLRYMLVPAVIAIPYALRQDRSLRLAAVGLVLFCAIVVLSDTNVFTHYPAPGGALAVLLLVAGLRMLCLWRPSLHWRYFHGRRIGRTVARLMVIVYLAGVGRYAWELSQPAWHQRNPDRLPFIQQLRRIPGKHIVFVNYGVPYVGTAEWVYNDADIDSQDIVWARYLGPERTRIAINYFRNRTPWMLSCGHIGMERLDRYDRVAHPPVPDVMANPVPLPRDLVGPNAVWPKGWEVPVHNGVRE
jgi:hypothetical protein